MGKIPEESNVIGMADYWSGTLTKTHQVVVFALIKFGRASRIGLWREVKWARCCKP